MSTQARWHAALAWALLGQDLALPEPGTPSPDDLVRDLGAAGWPVDRIRQHAIDVVEAGRPWPHQIPQQLRAGCGVAQLFAALGRTRALLGLVTLETRAPSARTSLDADELRLMREVPPHHGT